MVRSTVCVLLFATVQPVMASDPAEESITVAVVGTLRTGLVAIGGETTGTTITAKGISRELDFGQNAELRAAADKLNGKPVKVSGTLRFHVLAARPPLRIC